MYADGRIISRFTYGEFGAFVKRFAALFVSLGVLRGDRILILAENRPEWVFAYFGAAQAGAICAPVLTAFSAEQIQGVVRHAEPSLVCVTRKTAAKIEAFFSSKETPLVFLDSLEKGESWAQRGRELKSPSIIVSICGVSKRIFLAENASFPETEENDPAALIYTSGTLGESKGVMLSNRNLLWTAYESRRTMKIYPRDRLLSMIPLAHSYECTMGLLSAVISGSFTAYLVRPPSPSAMLDAIHALRPTAMLSTPVFIEKIYRTRIAPSLERNLFYRFPLTRALLIKAAGKKLISLFGGSLRFLGVGGAPLAEGVELFLRKAQFPYSPGYGLTETSPLVAGTAPYRFSFRSSGIVLEGVEVRIAPVEGVKTERGKIIGEIQVRGPNLMLGYYKDEAKTKAAFTEDGLFKTGDLGFLERKGRRTELFVRGRLKNVIIGAGGENIYPEEIETLLSEYSFIEDALVFAGEKGGITAIITVNKAGENEFLLDNVEKLEEFRRVVNGRLASFSRIDRIEIRDEPFEKTPTNKIKRFLYTPFRD